MPKSSPLLDLDHDEDDVDILDILRTHLNHPNRSQPDGRLAA